MVEVPNRIHMAWKGWLNPWWGVIFYIFYYWVLTELTLSCPVALTCTNWTLWELHSKDIYHLAIYISCSGQASQIRCDKTLPLISRCHWLAGTYSVTHPEKHFLPELILKHFVNFCLILSACERVVWLLQVSIRDIFQPWAAKPLKQRTNTVQEWKGSDASRRETESGRKKCVRGLISQEGDRKKHQLLLL